MQYAAGVDPRPRFYRVRAPPTLLRMESATTFSTDLGSPTEQVRTRERAGDEEGEEEGVKSMWVWSGGVSMGGEWELSL